MVRQDRVAGLMEVVVAECTGWGTLGCEDDGDGAEEAVVGGVEGVQLGGRSEAVGEGALAAEGGVVVPRVIGRVVGGGVREKVKELEAGGLSEVGVVGVQREVEVGVGGVDGVDFRGEVPELAVVSIADGADACE